MGLHQKGKPMKLTSPLSLGKFRALIRRTHDATIHGASGVPFLRFIFGLTLSFPTIGSVIVWTAHTEQDTAELLVGLAFTVATTVMATVMFIILKENIASEAVKTRKHSRRNHPTSIRIY